MWFFSDKYVLGTSGASEPIETTVASIVDKVIEPGPDRDTHAAQPDDHPQRPERSSRLGTRPLHRALDGHDNGDVDRGEHVLRRGRHRREIMPRGRWCLTPRSQAASRYG